MVVVIIISVLAALAIPTMIGGQDEGHVYHDAALVTELLRTARGRAMGRETAVAVQLTSSNSSSGPDLGTFMMYEAQLIAPVLGGVSGILFGAGTPMTTCGAPTVWPGMGAQTAALVDGANMNGKIEQQAGIFSTMTAFTAGAAAPQSAAWVCYTPMGRAYLSLGTTPTFVAGSPMTSILQIDVNRSSGGTKVGITRSVVIPPSGAARIVSH